MCIQQAKWIGAHRNFLDLNQVPIEDFDQTFHNGMNEICDLHDFNQVVDWETSSFIKQAIFHLTL